MRYCLICRADHEPRPRAECDHEQAMALRVWRRIGHQGEMMPAETEARIRRRLGLPVPSKRGRK